MITPLKVELRLDERDVAEGMKTAKGCFNKIECKKLKSNALEPKK